MCNCVYDEIIDPSTPTPPPSPNFLRLCVVYNIHCHKAPSCCITLDRHYITVMHTLHLPLAFIHIWKKELLVLFKSQTILLFPQIEKSVLKCWSLGGCQESRLLKTPEAASLNFLLNIPTWSDFAIGLVLLLTSLVFLSGCLILIVAILKSTLQGINHVYCLNFFLILSNFATSLSGLLWRKL